MAVLEARATAGTKTAHQHPSDRGLHDTLPGLATQGHPRRAAQPLPDEGTPARGPLPATGTAAERHPRGAGLQGSGPGPLSPAERRAAAAGPQPGPPSGRCA